MAEVIKETKPKRKSTPKKTTTKAETTVEQAPASNPALDLLANLSQEQLAQLISLVSQPKTAVVVNEPVQVVEEKAKPKRVTKAYLQQIRDREVAVRNVCNGRVTFVSNKTHTKYTWIEKGDIEYMTIGEILTMNAQSPLFLNAPWVVVDDEDVVEGLGLVGVKDMIDVIEDLDSLFDESTTVIRNTLMNLSVEHKHQIADQVSLKIQNKELRDIEIIRLLQDILEKEFLIFNY